MTARANVDQAHAADTLTIPHGQSAVEFRRVQNAVQRRLLEEFLPQHGVLVAAGLLPGGIVAPAVGTSQMADAIIAAMK
jgi:hypothetical protein